MRITLISIMPQLIHACLEDGVVGRAIQSGAVEFNVVNPRGFTEDVHQSVDDRPYGGGPGMVMKIGPLSQAMEVASQQCASTPHRVLLTPTGERFTQAKASEMVETRDLILICGRYEGLDQRFIDRYVDTQISIGDYVLSGGELPALVVLDAIVRLLPGTLGNPESAEQDSFEGFLLDHPHYTRPQQHDAAVPEVLLSGDHKAIAGWRRKQSLQRTWETRPDLLLKHQWTETDIQNYYELFTG